MWSMVDKGLSIDFMFQKGELALKKVHFLQQMAKSGHVDGL